MPIIKEKTNLYDLQKIMASRGELCNEAVVATKLENKLGQALIDNNIPILPGFKVDDKSFDFKLFHYPVLVEADGGYHNEAEPRYRDYQKDRKAQKNGFKVMRFTNWEIDNNLGKCVEEVKAMVRGIVKSPREVWLFEYTFIDRIKDWLKKRKPLLRKESTWQE